MIMLDTHVWIDYSTQNFSDLSETALNILDSETDLAISAISCWELAMLVQKKRIILNISVSEWIDYSLKNPRLIVIPLTHKILIESVFLPDLHKDPADRMIVATCKLNELALITADKKLHNRKHLKTIW